MERNFKHTLVHSIIVFLGFSTLYTLFFSPVLFSNQLLAPGDGIAYFLPAFYSAKTLWTNLIFSGYPIAADPQNMTWYPPAFLLSLIPHSWNAFIVLAYVLAGSFAYCYVYTVTKSKLAATVTGLTYSMSGFMIAHLGHVAMIHAAAWMPLIVCALEKLRHQIKPLWTAIGALAIVCSFLGGHPQISIYSIGIGFFYAFFLGWSAPIGRWKYYRWVLGLFSVGILLCFAQLLPTMELSHLSLRAEMTYENFIGGSLPLWQGLQLIFPFLFGGWVSKFPYNSPYWGSGGIVELVGYMGLLPLILGTIGTFTYRNRSITLFWFWAGLITLLLVFGDQFFLGKILYHIPIYNKFRIQARHFVEVNYAISVLAGLGVFSIQKQWASSQFILKILAWSGFVVSVLLASIFIFNNFFKVKASLVGISQLNLFPLTNPAIGIPLFIFFLGLITLAIWNKFKQSKLGIILLLIVLLLDLSSFGFWFYDWTNLMTAPSASRLKLDHFIESYRNSVKDKNQRLLTSEGVDAIWNQNSVIANLTRLWEIPNASGYSPLILSRFADMMHIDSTGTLLNTPTTSVERQLDLMSVRYLLASSPGMTEQESLVWAGTDLFSLGSGMCVSTNTEPSASIDLQNIPYQATSIAMVTTMGCSVQLQNQSEVVQIEVTDNQGKSEIHSLLTGRDTAEHAIDCADVKPYIQHQRAPIFRSMITSRPTVGDCQAHEYLTTIKLSRPQKVSHLQLSWTGLPAVINIKQISLINEPQGTSLPLTQIGSSAKWKKVAQLDSGIVYENQQVLPRTWLVPETIVLKPEEVLTAVHTSQLPDGRTYDPKTMALVEDGAGRFQSSPLKPTDTAKVLKLEETQVELQTQTAAPAFLVLSDVFYPGWKATVDGKPTQIFQTNYIQRGIKVPAGNHTVRFEFHPLSFKLGVGITMASLFASIFWLLRRSSPHSAG